MTASGKEFDSLVQLMNERFRALGNVPLFTTSIWRTCVEYYCTVCGKVLDHKDLNKMCKKASKLW